MAIDHLPSQNVLASLLFAYGLVADCPFIIESTSTRIWSLEFMCQYGVPRAGILSQVVFPIFRYRFLTYRWLFNRVKPLFLADMVLLLRPLWKDINLSSIGGLQVFAIIGAITFPLPSPFQIINQSLCTISFSLYNLVSVHLFDVYFLSPSNSSGRQQPTSDP